MGDVSWPEVACLLILAVRQEWQARRLQHQTTAVRQDVADSTLIVRGTDTLPWEHRGDDLLRRSDDGNREAGA